MNPETSDKIPAQQSDNQAQSPKKADIQSVYPQPIENQPAAEEPAAGSEPDVEASVAASNSIITKDSTNIALVCLLVLAFLIPGLALPAGALLAYFALKGVPRKNNTNTTTTAALRPQRSTAVNILFLIVKAIVIILSLIYLAPIAFILFILLLGGGDIGD